MYVNRRTVPVSIVAFAMIASSSGCSTRRGPDVGPLDRREAHVADNALTSDEIDDIQATRVEELIEGRFPGVRVIHRPNGEYSIQIRGAHTFYGRNDPLIVVDGMPVSPSFSLKLLNPNDISRIEIVRDALAGAYGIRGANGVVLITTRKR